MPLPPADPDTKDWTWVLERPCPECGLAAGDVATADLPTAIVDNARFWTTALAGPDVDRRPSPGVWSALEYACHVRDVHRVFEERARLMLEEDVPLFENWDQDETARRARYAEQDPGGVAEELTAAAGAVAGRYAAVPDDAWGRRGLRSNGSEFTVASLGRYHLHDVVHHRRDVEVVAKAATIAAYDTSAAAYRDGTLALPPEVGAAMDELARRLGAGARVLEIGSGPGRDARALEARGLRVRRTDVSPGFVALLRAAGEAADVLDPLVDDLADPEPVGGAYDGVWANACLLHVARADLPTVLRRLAAVTRPGGVLHVSLKEGDGEQWSTHGNVTGARLFTFWREGPLREVLDRAGWTPRLLARQDGVRGDRWLEVTATRKDA